MSQPIRVVLADDTLIAREGWKRILETEGDLAVVGEVRTAQEVAARVRKLQPDVLLLDLNWFGDDTAGITALAQCKRTVPRTKIIAITAYPELTRAARLAGAESVLPKGFSRAELIGVIRAVHRQSFPPPPPGPTAPARSEPRPELRRPVALAAAIGIPALGLCLIAGVFLAGVFFLSLDKFLAAAFIIAMLYFWGVVFAGRYVGIIGETRTYELFVQILGLFRGRGRPPVPAPPQEAPDATQDHTAPRG